MKTTTAIILGALIIAASHIGYNEYNKYRIVRAVSDYQDYQQRKTGVEKRTKEMIEEIKIRAAKMEQAR